MVLFPNSLDDLLSPHRIIPLTKSSQYLRVRKEIRGTFIHLIFRPSLADLQSRNPQNSATIPPVPLIQIDQI